MKRVIVDVKDALHQAAHQRARNAGITLSQAVRWFLIGWIRGDIPTPNPPDGEDDIG